MLDEEVKFELVRKAPKNRIEKSLGKLVESGFALGGAIGGFMGIKYGLEWGNLGGIFLGLGPGAGAGLTLYDKLEKAVKDYFNNRFYRRQSQLDEIAESNRADTANFEYRGNQLEYVIRPKYEETGHIFNMRINDNIIFDPLFSYQPQRQKSLKLQFSFPNLKQRKKPQQRQEGFEDLLEELQSGLLKKIVEARGGSVKTKKQSREDFTEEHYLKAFDKLVSEKEHLRGELTRGTKLTTLTLTYSGENYSNDLTSFCNFSSRLMNETYDFLRHILH